jgi:uncharacterized protein YndB with AHSA1/START domain
MLIRRSVLIQRPVAEVFEFVADPLGDPDWCPKVRSVEQVEGEGPGVGARYAVVHQPVPLRPARRMEYTCVASVSPGRLEWREDDGSDVIEVIYELSDENGATRFTQTDHAELGAPRLLHPVMKAGIGHDIGRQLRGLKRLLEG